jgi:hypothetical protein
MILLLKRALGITFIVLMFGFTNSLNAQSLVFKGLKIIDGMETVKFSVQGVKTVEELSIITNQINQLKNVNVLSFDLRQNVASVMLNSKKHISPDSIREILLANNTDFSSICISTDNKELYGEILRKEKELRQ